METDKIVVRSLISRIEKLTVREKQHILNILKEKDQDYTKNTNGYFFNILNIGSDAVHKLEKCLNLIETNRELITEMDKKREELLIYYKTVIEEKLKMSLKERRERYMQRLYLTEPSMKVIISRKLQIKCYKKNNDGDPDELMKQYLIDNKLSKKSAYSRIFEKIKAKRNKRVFDKDGDQEETAYTENYDENENEIDSECVLEYDNDGNVSESVDSEDGSSYDGSESDARSIGESQCDDTESTQIVKIPGDTRMRSLNFYKALLNEKGYKFNEASVPLQYQSYIE
jgi:hypothetical protein